VGVGGLVLHGNGLPLSIVNAPGSTDIYSIDGAGPADLWVAGAGGLLSRGTTLAVGTVWTSSLTGPEPQLASVWAASSPQAFSSSFLASLTPTVLQRQGSAWASVSAASGENAVFGLSTTDVWIGGKNGAVAHFDGTGWTANTICPADIHGLWGSASDDVWAVTEGATTGTELAG
jgi:hypothetical protein